MLPSYPGSLSPAASPGAGPWEPLGRERGMSALLSAASGPRWLPRTVEGETSAGNEGLGANWWDLMGMTGMDWERNYQDSR